MQQTKSLFLSKSFWFNIVSGVLNSNLLVAVPQPYGILAQTVGAIILRWVTTEPVTLTGKPIPTPPPSGPITEAAL